MRSTPSRIALGLVALAALLTGCTDSTEGAPVMPGMPTTATPSSPKAPSPTVTTIPSITTGSAPTTASTSISASAGTQATLPPGATWTVGEMPVGAFGRVSPYAMYFDKDSKAWIHPDYEVTPGNGSSDMCIQRMQDGIHVWPPQDHPYTRGASPHVVKPAQYLPVAQLHSEDSCAEAHESSAVVTTTPKQ